MKTILIPLPHYGFDPSEAAIPWKHLRAAGHPVVFATPGGAMAQADRAMLTGETLPRVFRKILMAGPDAVAAYREMEKSPEFTAPIAYDSVRAGDLDALMIPGGHDKAIRPFLESKTLQRIVATFMDENRPVAAICHGTLLVGRSVSEKDPLRKGKSVLWGRKTTALTRNQELIAYQITRAWLGDYYLTYDVLVVDELLTFLKSKSDYFSGPGFPIPTKRDSADDLKPGFVVRDGNYLSARWPGDAHRFSNELLRMLTDSS